MGNLNDTASWVDPVTGVDNGDLADVAEINNAPEQVAKRSRFLYEGLGIGNNGVEYQQPLGGAAILAGWGVGTFNVASLAQSGTTTPFASVECPRMPATGAVLIGAKIVVDPGTGRGGLPATMPEITLYRRDMGSGASSLGSQVDTSGSVGAYETEHDIEITGLTEDADDPDAMYIVSIEGESGANSQTGAIVLAVALVFDVTGQAL
jgi:hypothetical protein